MNCDICKDRRLFTDPALAITNIVKTVPIYLSPSISTTFNICTLCVHQIDLVFKITLSGKIAERKIERIKEMLG